MAPAGDNIAAAIAASGISIYDELIEQSALYYDTPTLEARLDEMLRGMSLAYPIRTRSKFAKAAVAAALGYPVPLSFRKTRPRFPGQNLDLFVQKSLNLQVWNEDIDPLRRYALLGVDADDVVVATRVLSGEAIALLDRTGTLTSKYQAARRRGRAGSTLVTSLDSRLFRETLGPRDVVDAATLRRSSPAQRPERGQILTIAAAYERVHRLVGTIIHDPGLVSDRLRGVELQRHTCIQLGLGPYADTGRFPDILSQVLEIKLQLAATIDLGLVSPDSSELLVDSGYPIRHADCRYAVFYASRLDEATVRVDNVVVTTGEAFFEEFRKFEGSVRNSKLQIGLPRELFEAKRSID